MLARKRAEVAQAAHADRRRAHASRSRGRRSDARAPARPGRAADHARRAAADREGRATRATSCVRDATFAGRVGWKAIVVAPGRRAPRCARACRPTTRRTACARYPQDLLTSPSDVRVGELDRAARRRDGDARPTARRSPPRREHAARRRPDAASFSDAAAGKGVLLAAARDGVRLGRAARALARPRQDDGRRLPGRHARHAAARGAARRDGDGHAHDRRLRARLRRARAVAVRAARGPVPVAEPRLGLARSDRRRVCAARPRCASAGAQHHHASPRRLGTVTPTGTGGAGTGTATLRPSACRCAACSRSARRPA